MNLDDTTFAQLTLGALSSASTLKPFVPQDKLRGPQAQRSSIGSLPLINIGCGEDLTMAELAALVARLVGYEGRISWDTTKPDGTPRKLLDISRLKALGWRPLVDLKRGIESTYKWYTDRLDS